MQTSLTGVKLDGTGSLKQTAQALEFAATTTVTINISVTGQNGLPLNLTGCALVLTVNTSTYFNAKKVVSIQATVDNTAGGTAHFTIPNTTFALARGAYVYDVTLVNANGSTDQIVPVGSLYIADSSYSPGQQITPIPGETPLGQGPGLGSIIWTWGVQTWSTILSQIQAVGGACEVILDPGTSALTDGTFIVGPASADLSRVRFIGLPNGSVSLTLQFDPAFRFLGNPTLNVTDASVTAVGPLYVGTAPISIQMVRGNFSVNSGSVGPIFDVSSAGAAGSLSAIGIDSGAFINSGTGPIFRLGAGAFAGVLVYGQYAASGLLVDGSAPSVGLYVTIVDGGANVPSSSVGTNVTFNKTLADNPANVSFSAAVPTNWAGTPPTVLKDAIDRIAAALALLNQKP